MAKGISQLAEQKREIEIVKAVTCDLPGFEGVAVSYDLMATQTQVDLFVRHIGAKGTHEGVIVKVEGWPAQEYGPDPWDTVRVPAIFQAWAAKKGWALAMKGYLDDPLS